MAVSIAHKGNAASLAVEGEMTIFTAAELQAEVFAVLAPELKLSVDLSSVTELDSSGIQLLLMLRRESTEHDGTFQIVAFSAAVEGVLVKLGFADLLRTED